MPRPALRTGSLVKKRTTTPGGRKVIHYYRRKPGKHRCSICGRELSSVPRERPYKIRRRSLTQKRPNRPYGGMLCAKCLSILIKAKARSL
jgi:large subunit ribosomal protein L34e